MKNALTRKDSEFRDKAGFTLIELAIVLVIIGIIIGAVLKGQDLVENGRHKRLGAEIKQWEVLIWTFFDRERRFPGDGDNSGKGDGTIGENGVTADDAKTDFTNAQFASQPSTNTLTLGSSIFYIYFGNAGTKKNAIIVCVSEDCGIEFSSPEEPNYAKFFDGAIDDTVDAAAGRVRGFYSVTGTPSSARWTATLTATSTVTSYASAIKAFAYFFDRKL